LRPRRRRIGPTYSAGAAYEYRAGESPVHRLGAGWKLLLTFVMGFAAVAVTRFPALFALIGLNVLYMAGCGLRLRDWWVDSRFFLYQTVIVVLLYLLRFGWEAGWYPGVLAGAKVVLFFMPGAVLLRTTRTSEMLRVFKKWLPARFAFLTLVSLRFVPYLAQEAREIVQVQRLRGVPLSLRGFADPRHWKEVFSSIMVPLMVRVIHTANEAALAAEARGYGVREPIPGERTCGAPPEDFVGQPMEGKSE